MNGGFMANKIMKVKVWSADIEDRCGATAEKLTGLSEAGADLHFVLARRKPGNPAKGVLYVAPVNGREQEEAACQAGFAPAEYFACLVVQGENKPGLGTRLLQALAKANLNLRGMSASVIGKQFTALIAFDNMSDADYGMTILRQIK